MAVACRTPVLVSLVVASGFQGCHLFNHDWSREGVLLWRKFKGKDNQFHLMIFTMMTIMLLRQNFRVMRLEQEYWCLSRHRFLKQYWIVWEKPDCMNHHWKLALFTITIMITEYSQENYIPYPPGILRNHALAIVRSPDDNVAMSRHLVYITRGSPLTSQISHLLLHPSLWLLVSRLSSQVLPHFPTQPAF